jgi:hypothetical protein
VVLRVLGFWKSVPFSAVHRLLPLGVFGVIMNVFTGMLMLMADTYRYVNETSFIPKMFFLPIGASRGSLFLPVRLAVESASGRGRANDGQMVRGDPADRMDRGDHGRPFVALRLIGTWGRTKPCNCFFW